jgi:hypothetical protein
MEARAKESLHTKLVKCSVCGLEQTKQGIGAHLRLAHGITNLNKQKPVETAIKHWYDSSPFEAPFALAEFILKMFNNDDKRLIKTIKEVKKKQDEED